jgi:3-methyladenine DNA glycosylase/8-oxoguanine DNA glycosylase
MDLILTAHPPFSFRALVRSHGWAQLPPFDWDEQRGVLKTVSELETGRVIAIALREAPDGVCATIDADLGADEREEVACQVHRMCALDRDLSAFYLRARREPRLAHVEPRALGRLLCAPTLFEDTVKTILTTNTAWSGTRRMVEALVAQFGAPLQSDPAGRAFPSPRRLADSDEPTLRRETRLGYRAPFVLALANAVASGALDLESFRSSPLPTPELRRELLAIKGLGPYAAASLLMLLGRYDYVPVDSWARRLVSEAWHDGEPVGPPEVEAAFAGWGEWRALAYWFWDWPR